MTGFLKKKLESLYYENREMIGGYIQSHCRKCGLPSTVVIASTNSFTIKINFEDYRYAIGCQNKLKEILGVPVMFTHFTEIDKYHWWMNFKLFYIDL